MKTVSAMILTITSTAVNFARLEVPITSSQVTSSDDQECDQVERAGGGGAVSEA